MKNLTCPRCGGKIPNNATPGAYPGALSRIDNETEVCSWCGVDEAINEHLQRGNDSGFYRDARRSWYDLTGVRRLHGDGDELEPH